MTAPEDPFRSPTPGSTPSGREPADRPESYGDRGGAPGPDTHPYGDQPSGGQPGPQPGAPQYGSPQPGAPQYGTPQYGAPQYGAPQYGAPQYGAPQYGSQQHGGPAFGEHRPSPRNGFGIAALVLGILAVITGLFLIGGLLGIAAIVLGVLGRGRAKRGEASNGGMALAGIVLGVLGLLLSALAVFGAVQLFNSDEFSNLSECLQSAGNDRAAVRECQAEFEDGVVGG